MKHFKNINKTDRFVDRQGFRWFVSKLHRKTKEVTAWRGNFFHEHEHCAGRQIGCIEIKFRISEINRLKWESVK